MFALVILLWLALAGRQGRRVGGGFFLSNVRGKIGEPWASNWLPAMAFRKPHSLRHGNRLILKVRNRRNQRSTII
jgi:hypothetical protein